MLTDEGGSVKPFPGHTNGSAELRGTGIDAICAKRDICDICDFCDICDKCDICAIWYFILWTMCLLWECMKSTHCQCGSERLNIELPAFDRGERTRFVEHVLDVLLESRFGPLRPYPFFMVLTDGPSLEKPVLYDLMPLGPLPSSEIKIFKREAVERDIAGRRRPVMSAAAGAGQHRPPTTLARGSPPQQLRYTEHACNTPIPL
jgi:hypothetical protein